MSRPGGAASTTHRFLPALPFGCPRLCSLFDRSSCPRCFSLMSSVSSAHFPTARWPTLMQPLNCIFRLPFSHLKLKSGAHVLSAPVPWPSLCRIRLRPSGYDDTFFFSLNLLLSHSFAFSFTHSSGCSFTYVFTFAFNYSLTVLLSYSLHLFFSSFSVDGSESCSETVAGRHKLSCVSEVWWA